MQKSIPSTPSYPLPTVIVTYQGKPLTLRYYDEHPEIHHLYPAKDIFTERLYKPLVHKARETNTAQLLEISENEVKINGVVQTVY
ncbi:MAG: hypothetical protein FGM46_05325 [Ferruginibacter sp.]|nr:hypothetical protein [Ferruginibacter sp.]